MQAKIKPRITINIQLFQDLISYVYSYALIKINIKKSKLPFKLSDPLL
jgi:hypothetical protein